MPLRRLLFALLALFLLIIPARAQFGGDTETYATAHLLADRTPLPAGSDAQLALVIDVAQDWHAQSRIPYESAYIATRLRLNPNPDITVAEPRFPVGTDEAVEPAVSELGKISLYRGSITALIPIKISPTAPAGRIKLSGKVKIQYCNDITKSCLPPTDLPVEITLTIAPTGTATAPKNANLFTAAEKQTFYTAEQIAAFDNPATKPAATTAAASPTATPSSTGWAAPGWPLATDEEQLAHIRSTPYAPANDVSYSLWQLALFALVGGAILNIMPCVLPVIPLKVLALVQQSHGNRRLSLLHAGFFAAGIISLFLALGAVLRIFGLFYGQQFQSIAFLIGMSYVVLALALSMLNVWQVNPPSAVYNINAPRTGYLGSFFSGLLATLLATPCSAPYLGPVLAWALVQPAFVTMLMLGLVGVGMALPYVILAAYPEALKKIPTAGRWAELFKQALGLVMVGVAVFLLTRIDNVTYWPAALFGAVIVAAVCWAWGQIPSPTAEPSRTWTIRIAAVVVGAALAFGVFRLTLPAQRGAAVKNTAGNAYASIDESTGENWIPFNTALLQEALHRGRPVVIDWTASWCLNCKFVEAYVLETEPVIKTFARKNVLLLRADISDTSPPAELLRDKLNSKSIPLLAIFTPDNPTRPQVLRDVYTAESVMSRLR